jgi:hypothetical protein
MKANSKLIISFTSFFVIVCSMEPAHAYLDPGSGSMIIQAVLAVIAAAGVSIGIFRNRIKLFFGRIFGGKQRDKKGPNE